MILEHYDVRGLPDYSQAVCDGCGAELPPATDYFAAVLSKCSAGWRRIKTPAGGHEDLCPDCRAAKRSRERCEVE